jgi:hypothetical protein
VSIHVHQAEVRDALRTLLPPDQRQVEPHVQGTVTLDEDNVALEDALNDVLHQVFAEFRLQNGVYKIRVVRIKKAHFDDAPLQDAMIKVLRVGRLSWAMSSDIEGRATCRLKNAEIGDVLWPMCGTRYRLNTWPTFVHVEPVDKIPPSPSKYLSFDFVRISKERISELLREEFGRTVTFSAAIPELITARQMKGGFSKCVETLAKAVHGKWREDHGDIVIYDPKKEPWLGR